MGTYKEVDIFILKTLLLSKEEIELYLIAKKYDWKDNLNPEKKDNRYWNNKATIIASRLKKMQEYGIVLITKGIDGKNEYNVIRDNLKYSRKDRFFNKYRETLSIREKNGSCYKFSLT